MTWIGIDIYAETRAEAAAKLRWLAGSLEMGKEWEPGYEIRDVDTDSGALKPFTGWKE